MHRFVLSIGWLTGCAVVKDNWGLHRPARLCECGISKAAGMQQSLQAQFSGRPQAGDQVGGRGV